MIPKPLVLYIYTNLGNGANIEFVNLFTYRRPNGSHNIKRHEIGSDSRNDLSRIVTVSFREAYFLPLFLFLWSVFYIYI